VVSKKRKRAESVDENFRWEAPDREPMPTFLKGYMQAMLKTEFPDAPVTFLNSMLAQHQHFYPAYIALAKARVSKDPRFGRGRPSFKTLADADTIARSCGWPILADELKAARDTVEANRVARSAEAAKKRKEEENLEQAKARGETTECSACFDDLPLNRQIHCNGDRAHWICYECAENYIKCEIGESRCRVLCTAGCGATFAMSQLNLLSDKRLLEKLAELEQDKAIRDAELDNLEECPFCNYKAVVASIEEDFEFRCANPECEQVSCRRCRAVTHIPISCEAYAKDYKINSRHKVEEAMTAAIVRSCNKCKKQFIKEYGCNKMTCPSCSNLVSS
jgi:E3 ubiquitin-protein ligase RNF216